MFYVMEYLDGRVFWDPKLPEISAAAERAAMYDEMNRVLAALHSVDPSALAWRTSAARATTSSAR
jgi:aminoglycoside phosphotransferase (APT) family kinase protein